MREKQFATFAAFVLLFCLGLMIYSNVLYGDFISDDHPLIVDNHAIRDLANLKRLLLSFNTRVLPGLSWALNYRLSGLNVFSYHLVNILIHIFNSFLVFILTGLFIRSPALQQNPPSRDPFPAAFLAAVIFLCHPLQTQAVSFIAQRTTVVAAFFYLLVMVLYWQRVLLKRRIFYVMSWAALLLGVASKEMIVTAPFMLFVSKIYFSGQPFKESIKSGIKTLWPFFLLVLSVPAAMVLMPGGESRLLDLPTPWGDTSLLLSYPAMIIYALGTYGRLMLFPFLQKHEYDYPLNLTMGDPRCLSSLVLLILLLVLGVRSFKKQRLLSFSIAWFFLTTPVELLPNFMVQRAFIFEHWMYLPMAGFALFVSLVLLRLVRPRSQPLALVLLVLTMSLMTFSRNEVWRNEVSFWEDNLQKTPDKVTVILAAAMAYQRKGLYGMAMRYYGRFQNLHEESPQGVPLCDQACQSKAFNNMGVIAAKTGRGESALAYFQKALGLDPNNKDAQNNLGICYLDLGHHEQAIPCFEASLRLQGDYPDAYFNLGMAYESQGKKQEARDHYQKAADLYRRFGFRGREQETRERIHSMP